MAERRKKANNKTLEWCALIAFVSDTLSFVPGVVRLGVVLNFVLFNLNVSGTY